MAADAEEAGAASSTGTAERKTLTAVSTAAAAAVAVSDDDGDDAAGRWRFSNDELDMLRRLRRCLCLGFRSLSRDGAT